jgi:hypothetical protein
MVILLSGSSSLGRSAIANRVVKEDKQWRHLPLEDLEALQPLKDIQGEERGDVMLRIACQCALELTEQGFHLIISCDYEPSALAIVQDELGDSVVCVHLGSIEELERSAFPYQLDAKRATVGEAYKYLMSLLPQHG